jgi:hypothetical protein
VPSLDIENQEAADLDYCFIEPLRLGKQSAESNCGRLLFRDSDLASE